MPFQQSEAVQNQGAQISIYHTANKPVMYCLRNSEVREGLGYARSGDQKSALER